MPYCGKRFWTRQTPTSCLPTYLVFIHIEHICTFFVTFFSATIDGRDLIFGHKLHIGTPYRGKCFWTHQIPTSCLPTLFIFIHIEHTGARCVRKKKKNYYIILQGGELTCFHFFKSSC